MTEQQLTIIPIDFLVYSARNPRQEMRGLKGLSESIKKYGVIQPITVRPKEEKFEVVVGERRVRAAEMAGVKEIPAIIRHLTTRQTDELRLIENIHREDLTDLEKGEAVLSLLENYPEKYPTIKAIADALDLPYSTVLTHWLPKVRRASTFLKEAITGDRLGEAQVRLLLKYSYVNQDKLAKKIIEHGLNKRQTEIFLKLYDEMPDADLNDLALQAKQVKHVMKLIPTGEAKEEIKKALERAGKPKPISEEVKKKISEARKKTEEIKRLAREKRAEEKIIPVKESSLPIITPFKLRREEKRVQKPLVEAPKLVEKPAIPADVKRAVRERPELKDYVEELSRIKDPEKRKRMIKATSKSLEAVKNQVRKRLERFPEKSKMMQPKFARLEELQNKGIILHTIWDFRYRDDYAGYRDFVSNCSPQLIEQCILRLTEEGDLVVDPMVGSGTTIDVCRVFNRRCIGYDIKPVRPDIIQEDARKLPLESDYADMIFIHPPYWKLTTYTKAEENLPDLSRAKTFEGFLGMLREVFKECYRVLKHTKYMCVLLGDLVREGKYVPICRKAANLAEEIGFDDCGYAVKIAHGEISRKKSGVIFAELAYTNYLKVCHDLIMFFRKP